jgi:hypothetical protein
MSISRAKWLRSHVRSDAGGIVGPRQSSARGCVRLFFSRGLATLAVSIVLTLAFAVDVVWLQTAPARALVGAPPMGTRGEIVAINDAEGGHVAGWYFSGNRGRGAVLLLHGVRANRRSQLAKIQILQRAGYTVLAIDQQAHGESDGDAITFGAREVTALLPHCAGFGAGSPPNVSPLSARPWAQLPQSWQRLVNPSMPS